MPEPDPGRPGSGRPEGAPPKRGPLVVDLDGTLIRTDMLYESFWASFAADRKTPLRALRALPGGRAALKRVLAGTGSVDVAQLPYNEDVLGYIRRWRSAGGRVALVTASDQGIAERIARHLGLFDEVHGSDGVNNLKGAAKARFLTGRYGEGGFVYVGDSPADVAVWQHAGHAVTANAGAGTRARAERAHRNAEHLTPRRIAPADYLALLEPRLWLWNLLVFVPLLVDPARAGAALPGCLAAFVVFGLVAAGITVFGSLLDLPADRARPGSGAGPLAAGRVPLSHGMLIAAGLIASGTLLSLPPGLPFLAVIALFAALGALHALNRQRRRAWGTATRGGLLAMRVVGGSVAAGMPLPPAMLAIALIVLAGVAMLENRYGRAGGAV